MTNRGPAELHDEVGALAEALAREGAERLAQWSPLIARAGVCESALNLAHYLALRRRDLRSLQRDLMPLGLSSLGRAESRVMPTLRALRTALAALAGRPPSAPTPADDFFAGERRLAANACALFGTPRTPSAAVMITCPSEASDDPGFMLGLAQRGVQAVRINCAHDDRDAWARMIGHLRAAETATGQRLKVFMDLAGPKIRTGAVARPEGTRVGRNGIFGLARPGVLANGPCPDVPSAAECSLAEPIAAAKAGDRVFIDDGKYGAVVEVSRPWGLACRLNLGSERGLKLKPERGLNFPDTVFDIPALTAKDHADLEFVAAHADAIEFSFVQSAQDIADLQQALAGLRPHDWRRIGLVLKIETARAVTNLPDMLVRAAGQQPTALMIARGDLAVEIGFARTAEMQEELLWLGEAADIPVIWATQVLEHLIKKGAPLRGEMTDAAMAARADCVMLNKGPYLLEGLEQLQSLLQRMEANQHKKAAMLRPLRSWERPDLNVA